MNNDFNLSTLNPLSTPAAELPPASFEVEEVSGNYGRFSIFPLQNGWGTTLGNAIRRTLLHSLPGVAITWAKLDNVSHEFSSHPHMHEEVAEFLLNIKGIRLRANIARPGRLRLEASGQGEVKAGDIMATGGDFEIVNPDHHLATLVDNKAALSVEFNAESGIGFKEAAHGKDAALPTGALTIDAIFSPVRRAAYNIAPRRYQSHDDVEQLTVEAWTDGTISAEEAVKEAAKLLRDKCHIFVASSSAESAGTTSPISPEVFNTTIESLNLSARTQNSLVRSGLDRVGQVLEIPRQELLNIRNFGEKSYNELFDKLRSMGVVDGGPDDDDGQEDDD